MTNDTANRVVQPESYRSNNSFTFCHNNSELNSRNSKQQGRDTVIDQHLSGGCYVALQQKWDLV